MKNTIVSLLQTRMDKCTTEQFWMVITITAFYSFLITHTKEIAAVIPRCLLFSAITISTAYGIWFVIYRHLAYYSNRRDLASLLADENDVPEHLKRIPDPSSLNSLSGVSFYVACLVVGCTACYFAFMGPFRGGGLPSSNLEIRFGTDEIKQPIFEKSDVAVKIQSPTNIEVNVKPAP